MNEEAQNKHENKGNTEIHENHVERKQASGYEQETKKRDKQTFHPKIIFHRRRKFSFYLSNIDVFHRESV